MTEQQTTESSTVIEMTFNGLVLNPGDKVLLSTVEQETDPETLRHMGEMFHERFPGVEFTIVHGVSAMAVQSPMDWTKIGGNIDHREMADAIRRHAEISSNEIGR